MAVTPFRARAAFCEVFEIIKSAVVEAAFPNYQGFFRRTFLQLFRPADLGVYVECASDRIGVQFGPRSSAVPSASASVLNFKFLFLHGGKHYIPQLPDYSS